MEFTTTIMYIMVIMIIIQFLLHIHKKNLFLLPTPTEVAFYATILYPTLQSAIYLSKNLGFLSATRHGIVLNDRTATLW